MLRSINCPRTNSTFTKPSSGLSKVRNLTNIDFFIDYIFLLGHSYSLFLGNQQYKKQENQIDLGSLDIFWQDSN